MDALCDSFPLAVSALSRYRVDVQRRLRPRRNSDASRGGFKGERHRSTNHRLQLNAFARKFASDVFRDERADLSDGRACARRDFSMERRSCGAHGVEGERATIASRLGALSSSAVSIDGD